MIAEDFEFLRGVKDGLQAKVQEKSKATFGRDEEDNSWADRIKANAKTKIAITRENVTNKLPEKKRKPGVGVAKAMYQRGYLKWQQKTEKIIAMKKKAIAKFEHDEVREKTTHLVEKLHHQAHLTLPLHSLPLTRTHLPHL